MATTLRIDSFNDINLVEHAELAADAIAGDVELTVRSTQGLLVGQPIDVGHLSREGIEKAAVASVDDGTTVTVGLTATTYSSTFRKAHHAQIPSPSS